MNQTPEFRAFIRSQRFRHFRAAELDEPPRRLWSQYAAVITVADQARAELGYPLSIADRGSYRDDETNRLAGGKSSSQHKIATALDLTPSLDIGPFVSNRPSRERIGDRLFRAYRVVELYRLLDRWRKAGRLFELRDRLIAAGGWAIGSKIMAPTCHNYHRHTEDPPAGAFRFKGGLGRYRTFVHVDIRGRNATWKSADAPELG